MRDRLAGEDGFPKPDCSRMKVVIADDEPLARLLLRSLLEDAADVEVVGEARNGVEAVVLTERFGPDAVFLDIDMSGGGGMTAAHELRRSTPAEIVFVTAHEPHAIDAHELGAIDYLLKPLRRPRLAKALDRIRARMREKAPGERVTPAWDAAEPAFWVRTRHGTVRVPVADILWIEAARDHVYFHTQGNCYLHRITMAELEHKLQATGVARVQRSAFVRLDKVTAILRRGKLIFLELGDAARVSVGAHYQAETLASLTAVDFRRP